MVIHTENQPKLPSPTQWPDNPYRPEWAERDYMYSADGTGEFPSHACKLSYRLSKPFIRRFRNALDVGCRVGEFTRYLQLDFQHVYAFDPNLSKKFMYNVDLKKVTHFHCALGDERGETRMYDGAHHKRSGIEPRTVQVTPSIPSLSRTSITSRSTSKASRRRCFRERRGRSSDSAR